jgi:hypothetical protein
MMKYTYTIGSSDAHLGPELARTLTQPEYLEIFRSNPWLYYLQKLAIEFIGFNMSSMFPFKVEELGYLQNFFLTRLGYMGVGSIGLAPSDLVCLAEGFSIPLILRPIENNSHILVGSAYIYGMMDGELWREEEASHQIFKVV